MRKERKRPQPPESAFARLASESSRRPSTWLSIIRSLSPFATSATDRFSLPASSPRQRISEFKAPLVCTANYMERPCVENGPLQTIAIGLMHGPRPARNGYGRGARKYPELSVHSLCLPSGDRRYR